MQASAAYESINLERGVIMKLSKKEIKNSMLLYAVTDRTWLNGKMLAEQAEEALKGGITFLQLREKELPYDDFLKEAFELKALCKKYNVPFVINDNVDIALACDADGVHVGQSDMEAGCTRAAIGPDKILGVSVQTVEEALKAQACGADYLGVGAVFPTSSKEDAAVLSYETLRKICNAVDIPVVAIGGISAENVRLLASSGIAGISVISALFAAKDIEAATVALRAKTEKMLAIKKILSVAGTDGSGGAGIQADIKTITAHKMYAMTAITAIVAQNTTGVYGVSECAPEFLALQLDCVFKDIRPDAVKIGMVSNIALIQTIAAKLKEYDAENIVVDPVMVSTSGDKLLSDDAIDSLMKLLIPMGTIITPNIPEAEVLCGFPIKNADDMERAAAAIAGTTKTAVLVKGGHLINDACDLLYADNKAQWFTSERIETDNTHGTGCTLSSAIACELAEGRTLCDSVARAKEYITGALRADLNLGHGSGPLEHTFNIKL